MLGGWVVVSEARGRRPLSHRECPFCPGNEHMTPPPTLTIEEGGRWVVRCFENLYPIIGPPQGKHEVLVETPLHHEHPHVARVEQLARAIEAALSRAEELMGLPRARYVAIFRNYGREAGASIEHPHTQIVALPFTPEPIRREVRAFRARCPICSVDRALVFYEDGSFTAYASPTPYTPYHLVVAPAEHEGGPRPSQSLALARALKAALGALARCLGDPPYNLWFHVAPPGREGEFHWHVEVMPRTAIHAGLEEGFWVYVTHTPPEEAASRLRACLSED